MKYFSFFFLAKLLLLGSCEVINPTEGIPSYIHIDTIELKISNSSLGSNSSKITDAWVYHENNLIGIYQLPSTIPILGEGMSEVAIAAGIMNNGKVNTRIAYPFYKISTQEVNLKPGSIDTLETNVEYFSASALETYVMEDFEFGNNMEKLSGDTSIIKIQDANAFNNGTSGYIYLDTVYNEFALKSIDPFKIASAGSTLFLEMDYKCTNNFSIGILVDNGEYLEKRYKITLVDREEWNKIYINLSNLIYGNTNNDYHLLIGGIIDNNKSVGEIYIDNLKLIGFKQ